MRPGTIIFLLLVFVLPMAIAWCNEPEDDPTGLLDLRYYNAD